MKNIFLFTVLLSTSLSLAQVFDISFEEPDVFSVDYVDTGDANAAHDLINNPNEPIVDFPETNGVPGYNARYEPYDTPGVGLTDGDEVGVTEDPPSGVNPFPNGMQGYKISDVDGNFILEFDPFVSFSTGPLLSISYFIAETGYEGDGTVNESGSDRLRIYVKDLTNNVEFDILDTTGSDINDLGIEGSWQNETVGLTPYNGMSIEFQIVIEARNNSGAEAFYFDNIVFNGALGVNQNELHEVTISPNPVSNGMLTISSKSDEDLQIAIYDVLGKLLIKTLVREDQLDVSNLLSGVYILKISQGLETSTKKLIVR